MHYLCFRDFKIFFTVILATFQGRRDWNKDFRIPNQPHILFLFVSGNTSLDYRKGNLAPQSSNT